MSMQFDRSRIERLLGQVDGAMHARARQESRHLGERFNLFSVLARYGRNDERYVHTPFLGTLLDPAAEHDLGDLFLRNFLDRALRALGWMPSEPLATANVRIEDDNVDIRILLDDFEIIIENKLHAPDQDKQLLRYIEEARRATSKVAVIYLTLRGTPPSQKSTGAGAEERTAADPGQDVPRILDVFREKGRGGVPVVLLSYEQDVRAALDVSLSECRADARYNSDVVGALEQYSTIVDRVLGDKAMTEPSEEAAILKENPDNLAIGLRMQAAASEAYVRSVAEFLHEIDECFQACQQSGAGSREDSSRLGKVVRPADMAGEGDKVLTPEQVNDATMIQKWAAGARGRTKKEDNHWAMLWYGDDEGNWAFSVELAVNWIFFGVVRFKNGTNERIVEDLAGESKSLPVWDSAVKGYGLRHAGAWKHLALVRALAEVPRGGGAGEMGSIDPDDPYGAEKLLQPEKEVFERWMKPYLGRPWDEVLPKLSEIGTDDAGWHAV